MAFQQMLAGFTALTFDLHMTLTLTILMLFSQQIIFPKIMGFIAFVQVQFTFDSSNNQV
jgi:hypothetical protein